MNILVIGNGFDLAHGLPTRYMDFLEFIEEYKKYKNDLLNESDYIVCFKGLKESKPEIYNEINDLINKNRWFHHFLKLKEYRSLNNRQTWIDFESEISKVIQTLDKVKNRFENDSYSEFNQVQLDEYEFEVLQYILEESKDISVYDCVFTLDQVEMYIQELMIDLNRLIRCLEIYLLYYVKPKYDKSKVKRFINDLNIERVLTFNYTDTYECLYNTQKVDFNYIHGRINEEHDLNTCNLVLGIDEYLDNNEKDKKVEFIQFKKFYQRIYKGTGCLYKDWLREYKKKVFVNKQGPNELRLFIIGHSLDVTDKDILKELILCEWINVTIYYHNQEALGRMIANLVKVIGEDELIRRTGGSNASIKFIQQPE